MIEFLLTPAQVLGQLVGLGVQLLGRSLGLLAGPGVGRLLRRCVGRFGHGGRMRGVDAGFGRRSGGRDAGGSLTIAGLGGRHVDQPGEGRSWTGRPRKVFAIGKIFPDCLIGNRSGQIQPKRPANRQTCENGLIGRNGKEIPRGCAGF